MMQQTQRARDAAAENARLAPAGVGRVVSAIQALQVDADMDRLETDFAREVVLNAANAQAVGFTCQPCGSTLPLEQGAYNPVGRVLCATCFAADAERRRNMRRGGSKEWLMVALVVVAISIAVAVYYLAVIR